MPAGPIELRMEIAAGQRLPANASIAVRIGDVRKQARLARSRRFKFPEESMKHAMCHIELFMRVGGATASLDTAGGKLAPVSIASERADLPSMSLSISKTLSQTERVDKKQKVRVCARA